MHKDLIAYKKRMELVNDVYFITKRFPDDEKFCLVNQMRRAAVSIPSNISESAARKNKKEFIQFLYISLGSLSELETQIEISGNLGYHNNKSEFEDRIKYIRNLITGLIRKLNNS